jgi:UDP-glucose 4-epimerase
MRILVTGAAGFIGSGVAQSYLAEGHEVIGIDNLITGKRENLPPKFPLFEFDLVEEQHVQQLLNEFRPEVISHHAAQVNVRRSWEDPLADARTNILGSLALIRSAVEIGTIRVFIYSSSGGAIYGEPEKQPVTEDHPARGLSNYGVSKYVTELYLAAYHANSGLRHIIFRYPNVYGPKQDPAGEAGVVAIFATQLLQGNRPVIFGDGSKTRDYVFIDDIVAANLLALRYDGSGVFNLGWGKEVSDFQVFQAVRDALGSTTEPVFDRKRPGEIEHIRLDSSRAREKLRWAPQVEFSKGVSRVVEFWKKELKR